VRAQGERGGERAWLRAQVSRGSGRVGRRALKGRFEALNVSWRDLKL
jgi:hypothetical protein